MIAFGRALCPIHTPLDRTHQYSKHASANVHAVLIQRDEFTQIDGDFRSHEQRIGWSVAFETRGVE